MILHLDTSALVRLYVEETHSERVRSSVAEASLVSCHELAYVELGAALARKLRSGDISDSEHARCLAQFEADWRRLYVIGITETLLREAVKLARNHGLRAYDSVHLAAVKSIHQLTRERVPLRFAVFDTRLRDAARTEGTQVLDIC